MKRILISLTSIAVIASAPITISASNTNGTNALTSIQQNIRSPKMVDESISSNFPDVNLANAVAKKLGVGVDAILTQAMVDRLTYLDASRIGVVDITGISILSNLQHLDLAYNKILSVPDELLTLTSLTWLDLNGNQLTSIPSTISNLSSLTSLRLSYNSLANLPDSIGDISSLLEFTVSGNQLITLPSTITRLTQLEILSVGYNDIVELPNDIGSLSKLSYLEISDNQIMHLPESVSLLVNLNTLYASNNSLDSLPININQLIELKSLDLAGNSFVTIPEGLMQLLNLEHLRFYSNQLTSIPDSIGNLTKLVSLGLSFNQLTEIPSTIGNITALEVLYIDRNSLTTIPDSLGELSHLKVLSAYSNQLTTIPDSIYNITTLEALSLASNELVMLDDNLGNLTQLKELLVSNNQFTSLPNSIANLTKLERVVVGDNLLPSDVVIQLQQILPNTTITSYSQRQLALKIDGVRHFDIINPQDLTSIDLLSLVDITQVGYEHIRDDLSPYHQLKLEGFVNEAGEPVLPGDYLVGNSVIKSGKVFVRVRAEGAGLFANTSDHALTLETIELEFHTEQFILSFDLNGGTSTTIPNQSVSFTSLAKAVETPVREGYSFNGWNTVKDGSGVVWDFNTQTMPANNITVYAQWTKNSNNNNSSSSNNNDVLQGDKSLPATGISNYNILAGSMLLVGGLSLIVLKKKRDS